jgi:acetyltransferase-like isoleucine patch superfamily enzyme
VRPITGAAHGLEHFLIFLAMVCDQERILEVITHVEADDDRASGSLRRVARALYMVAWPQPRWQRRRSAAQLSAARLDVNSRIQMRFRGHSRCGLDHWAYLRALPKEKVNFDIWEAPPDGSGGELSIGDQVDISAGVHIYTHDTVQRAISGGVASAEYAPTRIGSCVYIGPHSVIQKGVRIGDGVVIGAMSLVNRDVPSNTKVWEYRLLQNRPLVSKNLRNCWRSSCGRRFNGWRRPVYAGRSETRDLG